MTKQELEIAMAACCVGTMWDEYEGTEDFDHMVRLRLNHLIELVRKSKPSLPSNLDEAAEEYVRTLCDRADDNLRIDTTLQSAFKAGAEWMAGQFVLVGGEPTGWFRANDGSEYATGLDLEEPIKLPVDFYVRKK